MRYVVIHKKTGIIFEALKGPLATLLINELNQTFLQCTLGASSDFEIIGEL